MAPAMLLLILALVPRPALAQSGSTRVSVHLPEMLLLTSQTSTSAPAEGPASRAGGDQPALPGRPPITGDALGPAEGSAAASWIRWIGSRGHVEIRLEPTGPVNAEAGRPPQAEPGMLLIEVLSL